MKRKRRKNRNHHDQLFAIIKVHMYISSYRYVSVVFCLFLFLFLGGLILVI